MNSKARRRKNPVLIKGLSGLYIENHVFKIIRAEEKQIERHFLLDYIFRQADSIVQ